MDQDKLLEILIAFFRHEFAHDGLGVAQAIEESGVDIDSFIEAVRAFERTRG